MTNRNWRGIVGRYIRGEVTDDEVFTYFTSGEIVEYAAEPAIPLTEDPYRDTGDYGTFTVAHAVGDIPDDLFNRVEAKLDEYANE